MKGGDSRTLSLLFSQHWRRLPVPLKRCIYAVHLTQHAKGRCLVNIDGYVKLMVMNSARQSLTLTLTLTQTPAQSSGFCFCLKRLTKCPSECLLRKRICQ
ncbi:UNVERIFIED_CONTAM: hypothetical protein FKN15_023013 [Acipenser sinensis]